MSAAPSTDLSQARLPNAAPWRCSRASSASRGRTGALLAMVLVQRACARLSASLEAIQRWVVVRACHGRAEPGADILAALGYGARDKAGAGTNWFQADAVLAAGGGAA